VLSLINDTEDTDITAIGRYVLWILVYAAMVYATLYTARGVVSCLRDDVRWGEELVDRRSKLEQRRTELEQKPNRTAEENKELAAIPEELEEIRKELAADTRPRELTML
jgi:predicted nuclease with TOPRIM domain